MSYKIFLMDEQVIEKIKNQIKLYFGGHLLSHTDVDVEYDSVNNSYVCSYKPPQPIQYIQCTIEFDRKCECGSEKAKTPGHSTWCPKYEG